MTAPVDNALTPKEMAVQFRNLVDDDFDIDHLYQLLSQAKNYVERVYKLEICKKSDSSQSASQGDTYTNFKSLPTDFRAFVKLYLDDMQYWAVKFEDLPLFKGVGRKVILDMRQNKFAATSPVSKSGTWNLYYIYKTEDFNSTNENTVVCTWPSEFHPLIPYQAAKIYQSNIDGDNISFRMSQEQEKEYQRLLDAVVSWDADLKLAGMDGRTGFDPSDQEQGIDLGMM